MPPKDIIIDTDPGQDDAAAILLALGSPDEINLLGITAVAGNVPLALTQKKCSHCLRVSGQNECTSLCRLRRATCTQIGHRRACSWQDWP